MNDSTVPSPFGAIGPGTGRNSRGQFVLGNPGRVTDGYRSRQFWEAAEEERREIAAAVIADAGFTPADAPRALRGLADGFAQSLLVRDSAFARVAESGGPLTASGRGRRALTVWLNASASAERLGRSIGLRREPRRAPSMDEYLAQRAQTVNASTDEQEGGS